MMTHITTEITWTVICTSKHAGLTAARGGHSADLDVDIDGAIGHAWLASHVSRHNAASDEDMGGNASGTSPAARTTHIPRPVPPAHAPSSAPVSGSVKFDAWLQGTLSRIEDERAVPT